MSKRFLGASAVFLVAVLFIATAQANQSADPLATPFGFQLGAQLSGYRYEEPTVGVKVSGSKVGITGAYTSGDTTALFTKIDFRFAYGGLRYEGSGTLDGVPDTNVEIRAIIGHDFFPSGDVSLSPYVGYGYRFLYNDLRGYTSTGAIGYRRYSNYWYVPLGLASRWRAGGQWIIAPTVEYDVFLTGTQVSKLSDTGLGFSDATNTQDTGYGYRISLMFESGRISFGPWMHYWNIDDSNIVPIGMGRVASEPKNWTREIGLEFRYQF